MISTATYTAILSSISQVKPDELLEMLRVLYHSALQERIDAYREIGQSPGTVVQAKSLTEICNNGLCFEADRDVNSALNILHRGLGMSLKPGGNFPARKENENDGVALEAPTAQNSVLWTVKYVNP